MNQIKKLIILIIFASIMWFVCGFLWGNIYGSYHPRCKAPVYTDVIDRGNTVEFRMVCSNGVIR